MRWPAQLALLLPALLVAAKKGEPEAKHTPFKTPIVGLLSFDDSEVILFPDVEAGSIWRSTNAGFDWEEVDRVKDTTAIIKHPYDANVAVALGLADEHYITKDQGETWTRFVIPGTPDWGARSLAFHADDSDRIIFQAEECFTIFDCTHTVYYTLDGFDKPAETLYEDAKSCMWAKTTQQFTTGDDDLDRDRILCNVDGEWSFFEADSRILISDDFFESGHEPLLDSDRAVSGIISLASVTGYLAAAAKSEGSEELALYVTDDTIVWHLAEFGDHKIEQSAYTILESTNYSIQIDVQTQYDAPIGTLFTSNSNGTFFTKNIEHTNRNINGYVDFEKIQNIQGIVMVNIVTNMEDLDSEADKNIETRISFDDGRTWNEMFVGKKGEKALHLHSVTDQVNTGRVYSSPAPGIVMGVGNTGKGLKARKQGDTYISTDAGLTWELAIKGPHLYEMGDGGALLVAIEDDETSEYKYSIDYGSTWATGKLDHKIQPSALTTTASSTTLKFIIVAEDEIVALDFSTLKERTCGKGDFEEWPARVDEHGDAQCVMGHTTKFNRRKPTKDCFIEAEDIDTTPIMESCECTEQDYECDYDFVAGNNGTCEPAGALAIPKGACEGDEKTYEAPSGYRLIPGNQCKKGVRLADETVTRKCGEGKSLAPSGEINATATTFPKAVDFEVLYYLERCETCTGEDETIIALTDKKEVYISHDHGKNWAMQFGPKDKVSRVFPHQYFNDYVFVVTESKRVYYSTDRAKSFHHFDAPSPPPEDNSVPLSFHPKKADWMIWTSADDGEGKSWYTRKQGDDWQTLLRNTERCDFIFREGRQSSNELIYCQQFDQRKEERVLMASNDWFEKDSRTLKSNVVSFATMAEYIVVALKDEEAQTLKLDASVDGEIFADAVFPPKFEVEHQTGYTVLNSNSHAILVHVTTNPKPDFEYGAIIKSNSNGTDYVMSIRYVNRNRLGYVDFEKVQGLEGVAIVNMVANPDDDRGEKQFQTVITHNDGALWETLRYPDNPNDLDVDWCSDSEGCSLHLHHYTEREDARDTFSSPSAVGLLMGNGNVGKSLEDIDKADTFMSTDAGVSWSIVEKGRWLWKYGDRGSIIVIVKKGEAVDALKYTLDEGKTWSDYAFSNEPVLVRSLMTLPSDTSRSFLITGHTEGKKGDLVTINIDFSGLEDRSERCTFDEENPHSDKDDYYLWSPKHPLSDNDCLFGHIAQYHRKIADKPCFNGQRVRAFHNIKENCECTRRDFECAYNYEPQSDGSCQLVPGLSPQDAVEQCKQNPNMTEYYDITGYRRLQSTTCEGGKEFDSTLSPKPCPGFEDEFDDHHRGISGAGLFFAIIIPIGAAAAIGWYVYRNWDGKFGRIQLGDGAAGSRIGMGGAFDRDAPWIKYPVLAVSAAVAVIAAVPLVVSTVWRTLSTRFGRSSGRFGSYGNRPFTSRGSFQRSRGNYSVVDPDEGELLGDDSEDDEA